MGTALLTSSRRYSDQERRQAVCTFLRTFADQPQVDFRFTATPCTNGKTVWLGDCELPSDLFETLALGHGIHEMMHVRHTDFNQPVAHDPLTQQLLNCLEDVRLDRLGASIHPTYRFWREDLAACCEQLGRLRVSACKNQETTAIDRLVTWLHCELYARDGYRWAISNLAKARGLVQRLQEKCKRALIKESLRVIKAQSTNDCLKIALKLRAILALHATLAEQEQAQEAMCATPSLFEDAPGTNSAETPNDFLRQLLNQTQNKTQDEQTFEPGSASKAFSGFAGFGMSVDNPPDEQYRVGQWPSNPRKTDKGAMRREFVECYQKLEPSLAQTTQAFSDLLKTYDDQAELTYGNNGTDLRDDWIDVLVERDARLFENTAPGRSVNAEICVLLDRSGSMGVATMTLAKAAVWSLLCSIDRVKGACSRLALFPGLGDKHVAVVKHRHEPFGSLKEKMPSIDAFGSTPIQESMHWALDSFRSSNARDKLLVVITDGRFDANRSQRMQEQLQAQGVEFALMSIDIDNAAAARNHVLVHTPEQINDGLVRLMSQTAFVRALHG